MLGELTLRELKDNAIFKTKGAKKYVNLAISLVVLSAFIGIEIFIYSSFFDKVKVYSKFNDSLLIIVLFATTLLCILSTIPLVIKTFFGNPKEKIILGLAPVTKYEIIIAKGVKVLTRSLFLVLSSVFVFACVYGFKSKIDFTYYIIMFLNSIMLALFVTGISFILAIPVHMLMLVIKKYKLVTIIITVVSALLIALAYGFILHVYINLVRNASLDYLFTTESVAKMTKVAKYLYPLSGVVFTAINVESAINAFAELAFCFVSLFVGFFSMKFYLGKFYNSSLDFNRNSKDRVINYKILSPTKALVKKELSLAISNSEGLFSYLILILLQPFLVFGVVSSINLIFHTGNLNYISTLFPTIYVSLDTLLVLLFASVINMTSSITLDKEKDTLINMKTMPISFKKQLFIKISVFFTLSFISFFATILSLAIAKEITWISFSFLILIGGTCILDLNLISLFNDLKFKDKSGVLSIIFGFVLPIIVCLLTALLTIVVPNKYDEIAFLSVIASLNLIILFVLIICFIKFANKLFIKYEGGNK